MLFLQFELLIKSKLNNKPEKTKLINCIKKNCQYYGPPEKVRVFISYNNHWTGTFVLSDPSDFRVLFLPTRLINLRRQKSSMKVSKNYWQNAYCYDTQ